MPHGDPHRTEGGQFAYLPGATPAEQAIAGVGLGDNPWTAAGKVEANRRAAGLDPSTGLAFPAGAGAASFHASRGPVDASQSGEVLWRLAKAVILLPLAIAAALAALAYVAAMIGARLDGPTLAARAASGEFGDYQAPFAKERAVPASPAEALAAYRAFAGSKGTDPKTPRGRAAIAEAYRCVFQTACREAVAKLDPTAGIFLPRAAAGVFRDKAKAGDEAATRDMCLFAAKAGYSRKDLLVARQLCESAVLLNPDSKAGRQAQQRLDGSWAARRAWIYELVD